MIQIRLNGIKDFNYTTYAYLYRNGVNPRKVAYKTKAFRKWGINRAWRQSKVSPAYLPTYLFPRAGHYPYPSVIHWTYLKTESCHRDYVKKTIVPLDDKTYIVDN